MIEFLGGAVTLAYFLASMHFARFWRRTGDRLFFSFSGAFVLLGLNQAVLAAFAETREETAVAYLLRILAFVIILFAIVEKNMQRKSTGTGRMRQP